MKELTIGEIARRAGIQTSAIRYYESIGLIPPPRRVNGHRRYDSSVLKRLGLILFARQIGFRISELQTLFSEFSVDTPASTRWQALATAKITEMDALMEHTQTVKAWLVDALHQCQCVEVGDCATVTFDETGHVQIQKREL